MEAKQGGAVVTPSPFDQAWTLLKESRQTELGEHYGFEDEAFSSQGPVRWYHGTTATPAQAINTGGLYANRSINADPTGAYVTSVLGEAEEYANRRAEERGDGGPRVIGVRQGAAENPGFEIRPEVPPQNNKFFSRHNRYPLSHPVQYYRPGKPEEKRMALFPNRIRTPSDNMQTITPNRRYFGYNVPREYLVGPRPAGVRVIKQDTRQTELGEFPGFEDAAFSSYGPITHYHGTTVGPAAAIESQGLQPRLPYEAQLNQAQIAARLQGLPVKDWDPEGVYAATRQQDADKYARWRGIDRFQAPTVFGIRGGGLDFQSTALDGYLGYYPEAVPRSRLIRVQ